MSPGVVPDASAAAAKAAAKAAQFGEPWLGECGCLAPGAWAGMGALTMHGALRGIVSSEPGPHPGPTMPCKAPGAQAPPAS